MGYFIGVVLILLLTFSYCNLLKRSFAYCLPFSILSIISALYVFGLFTILNIGAYIVSAIILILFTIVLVKGIRKKEGFNFKFSNFAFIFFIAFAILQFFALKDRYIIYWDEFSHWGTIVKNMFYSGDFGNLGKSVLFPGYPPATGIFHAFFMFLGNKFVDGYMYMSMNLLSISMILPIFDNLNGKFNIKNVAIAIIGLVLPLIFNASFFASIYVDVFLGLMFAYIVYTYLSSKRIDYVLFANLSLACFVLCVVKAAGLGLCLIALIIISLDSIIFRRQEIKEFFRNKINILVCLLPVVAVVVAKVSWNCYLIVFKLNEAWDVSAVTFKSVVEAFVHPTSYQVQIFREFIRRSFVSYFGGCINLSLVAMMILMCLVYLVPSIWDKKKGRDFYFAIALFVGFIVYLVSTLILYWFTYGAYEATTLASFERYCSTYLVACIMLLFYKYVVEMFGDSVENTTKSNFLKYFGVALTFIAFTFVPMITVINDAFNPTREARMVTSDFENFASGLDSEKDRVWFIHCDSSGYYYHQAVFVAKPLMLNDCYTWSPGESRSESDLWSYNISKDDWANELKTGNFTYVYIQQADTIFKETYGSLFESIDDISDYSEYKVQLDGEQVKLVKI